MRPLILLAIFIIFMTPPASYASGSESYILVGGQSGIWFQQGQNPKLYKISLSDHSVIQLTPVPSEGTVWTGGWNGSQWLISGWGTYPGPHGSNPYLYLYDGETQVVVGSLTQFEPESSWHGGDVFATSYNGQYWLLSGMGSDSLPGLDTGEPVNHMSLATFDDYNFTDLSGNVPRQQEGILYANAWNGTTWLVGGGYADLGVLFTFDGKTIVDLTDRISTIVPSFASVQSIAWNGKYWLIGGIGFFARYDGHNFTDLTTQLQSALRTHLLNTASVADSLSTNTWSPRRFQMTVNAIAWNGTSWMLGGGSPVAQRTPNVAWALSYGDQGFIDISSLFPAHVSQPTQTGSSILSICYAGSNWILAGYSDNHAILFLYEAGSLMDMSNLVPTMSYAIWVGANTS
jgi:hypothetical protein